MSDIPQSRMLLNSMHGVGQKLYHIVGLVYNYRNSLSEDFTGDAKNVL